VSKIDYQALREAAQNYQSTLAWYEAIPDSPCSEVDCRTERPVSQPVPTAQITSQMAGNIRALFPE